MVNYRIGWSVRTVGNCCICGLQEPSDGEFMPHPSVAANVEEHSMAEGEGLEQLGGVWNTGLPFTFWSAIFSCMLIFLLGIWCSVLFLDGEGIGSFTLPINALPAVALTTICFLVGTLHGKPGANSLQRFRIWGLVLGIVAVPLGIVLAMAFVKLIRIYFGSVG